jgi:glycosyltransferase involved in cell wall biosynthesis
MTSKYINEKEKHKVLTVVRHPYGGIKTYLKYTYGHLDKTKYHFTILTPQIGIDPIKEALNGLNFEIIEVKGDAYKLSVNNFTFLFSFGWKLLITLIKNNFALIHSQGSSCGTIASLVNLIFRKAHIITFHETFDDSHLNIKLKKIISFLFAQADLLNTVSNDAKNNLLEYFPALTKHLDKIIVIKNCIDTEYFSENIEHIKPLSDIEGINEDTFVIGFLGRYMPEKGFPVLINAIGLINTDHNCRNKVKVLALGWGAYIREYQALIKKKGLNDYFVFIDFQSDIRWVIRQFDLLVIPSLREACPLVPMEGLVSGTPIVASDCIGLREVLKDTPATLVKPGDPSELAAEIIKKMNDPKKNEALKFIPEAKKRFDANMSAEKLELCFDKTIARNTRRLFYADL